MIIWTKEFEVGSEMIDQQHRVLIEKINLLENLLHTTNFTQEQVQFALDLVDYLEAYANIHFNHEERCMEIYHCPAHARNQQEHERLREFVRDYKKRCENEGFIVEPLRDLHGFMHSWIQQHILKVDIKLRPCIQK